MPRVQHAAAAAAIVAVSCPPIKKDTAACHVSPIKTKSAYKERNWPPTLLTLITKLNICTSFCNKSFVASLGSLVSLVSSVCHLSHHFHMLEQSE